jgi:hypothetical protein
VTTSTERGHHDDVVAPETGEATLDAALSGLSDLSSVPVAEHHDRLTRAHESLQQALSPDADASQ